MYFNMEILEDSSMISEQKFPSWGIYSGDLTKTTVTWETKLN
jgi:hypothetical protein